MARYQKANFTKITTTFYFSGGGGVGERQLRALAPLALQRSPAMDIPPRHAVGDTVWAFSSQHMYKANVLRVQKTGPTYCYLVHCA